MNLSSIVSNISLSICFNNYGKLEAMKGGGNHHMLCSPEKSNTYSVSNDRERCSISQMKAMGYGKAKALLEDLRAATH